jgi:hypothetical protein
MEDSRAASGALRYVLVPQNLDYHGDGGLQYVVTSVEVWTEQIVVIAHCPVEDENQMPDLVLEDHLGTHYVCKDSGRAGTRVFQTFKPGLPPNVRSLSVRSLGEDENLTAAPIVVAVPAAASAGNGGPALSAE